MTRFKTLLVAAVLGLAVGAPAWAEGPATRPHPEPQGPVARMIAERFEREAGAFREALAGLGLSDDQKAQIKQVFEDFHKKVAEFKENHKDEIEKIKADAKAAFEAKDKAAMEKVREEVRKLLEDAPKPREILEGIKPILTEEQRKDLREKLEAIREKAQENHPAGTQPTK